MNTNDLLAMLNGGLPPRGGAGGTGARGSGRDDDDDGADVLASFRAGKMVIGAQKENGKHTVVADKKRGTARLVRSADSLLHFQWRPRKSKRVIAPLPAVGSPSPTPEGAEDHVVIQGEATFERYDTGRELDRVYLLSLNSSRHFFYWMQEADAEKDREILTKVTAKLAASPAPVVSETMDGTRTPAAPIVGASGSGNLSVATPATTSATAGSSAVVVAAPASSSGRLTLADLRGAMASLGAPREPVGPPLVDLATSENISASGILDDPAVRRRLTEALPEGQRGDAELEEHLRSPQVRQALRTLTSLVAGDSFNSVIANFQLNAADGASAMAAGNPIRAFLDCVVASVNNEKDKEENSKSNAGGKKDTDVEDKE